MVLISNKPNIRGIRRTAEDVKYRAAILGRDTRLFMGLITTRIYGMGIGFILAIVLIGVPILWVLR